MILKQANHATGLASGVYLPNPAAQQVFCPIDASSTGREV
ncbi:MAG: hypothetical protein ACI87W_003228 [Halieaceae bacterium]|jgi:hypothetical protein